MSQAVQCEKPGTGEFPAQMASNAENVSIWWRHHEWKNWIPMMKASWHSCIQTNIIFVYIDGNRFKSYPQILWPHTSSERPELAEIWTHIVLGWVQGYRSQCPSDQVLGNLGTDRTVWRQAAPFELMLPGNWCCLRTRWNQRVDL